MNWLLADLGVTSGQLRRAAVRAVLTAPVVYVVLYLALTVFK